MQPTVPDLFDTVYYLKHLPKAERSQASAPCLHYLQTNGRFDPSPYFDSAFYRRQYGSSIARNTPPLIDYLQNLKQGEERQTHPLFDPDYYRTQVPELPASDSALLHFARHGDSECRSPSEGFDAQFYVRCYLPLQSGFPFAHYIYEGRDLGYQPRPMPQDPASLKDKGPFDILIIGHDTQPAGAPMQLLALVAAYQKRRLRPLVIVHRAGPLLPLYQKQAEVLVLDEGWQLEQIFELLTAEAPVLTNTVVTLDSAIASASSGRDVLTLIHELPVSISAWGMDALCQEAQSAGIRFGFSTQLVQEWFETLLISPLAPDQAMHFGPGRYTLPQQAPAPTPVTSGDMPLIIGIGHADHRKGLDLFLEAARHIQDAQPDAVFAWLGALDSSWAKQLATDAITRGLRLSLPGHVDPITPWLQRADALLITSRAETGPATLLEALCEGCRCIGFSSGIGFADELDQFGWAIDDFDPHALAQAALQALDAPRPTDQIAKLRARYDFTKVVENTLRALAL